MLVASLKVVTVQSVDKELARFSSSSWVRSDNDEFCHCTFSYKIGDFSFFPAQAAGFLRGVTKSFMVSISVKLVSSGLAPAVESLN